MPRKPIADAPMTDAERRRKSSERKLKLGEHHLTLWINADATKALRKITGPKPARGAIKAAIEAALLTFVKEK